MTIINIKVGLYGDSDVGKSTLISYLQTKKFKKNKDITIGVDYYTEEINIKDIKVKFQIWDTAGQERYNSIITRYYTVNIPIFIFDTSSIDSFYNLTKWVERYNTNKKYDPILLYCIGNKTDLGYNVNLNRNDIIHFCEEQNLVYHENSYINNNNIDFILQSIATEICSLYKKNVLNISNISIDNIITLEGYTRFSDRVSIDDDSRSVVKNLKQKCC